MDEVETLALDLGSKLPLDELQTLTKLLTFIVYGRGIEVNGHQRAAQSAPEPKSTSAKAPANKGRAATKIEDDEPGF